MSTICELQLQNNKNSILFEVVDFGCGPHLYIAQESTNSLYSTTLKIGLTKKALFALKSLFQQACFNKEKYSIDCVESFESRGAWSLPSKEEQDVPVNTWFESEIINEPHDLWEENEGGMTGQI